MQNIIFYPRGLIKINEAEGVETKLDGGWKQMHPASNYRVVRWSDPLVNSPSGFSIDRIGADSTRTSYSPE